MKLSLPEKGHVWHRYPSPGWHSSSSSSDPPHPGGDSATYYWSALQRKWQVIADF
jgi:hypothetical protein